MREIQAYYDQPVAHEVGMTGAGLIWFLTRDHLSPPYINRDDIALDAKQWRRGASEKVLGMIQQMGILPEAKVLDIGTGIGGPGRDIIHQTNCNLVGINLSFNQLISLRSLSNIDPIQPSYKNLVNGDAQLLPFISSSLDHIFTVNAFYHIPNIQLVIQEVTRVLKPQGTFGLDDWFITGKTSNKNHEKLRYIWSSERGFHKYTYVKRILEANDLKIVKEIDYTKQAGMMLTEDRLGKTYDEQVRQTLINSFIKLYPSDKAEIYAVQSAQQLKEDILFMGILYRNGQAVYRQIIAQKAKF